MHRQFKHRANLYMLTGTFPFFTASKEACFGSLQRNWPALMRRHRRCGASHTRRLASWRHARPRCSAPMRPWPRASSARSLPSAQACEPPCRRPSLRWPQPTAAAQVRLVLLRRKFLHLVICSHRGLSIERAGVRASLQ